MTYGLTRFIYETFSLQNPSDFNIYYSNSLNVIYDGVVGLSNSNIWSDSAS